MDSASTSSDSTKKRVLTEAEQIKANRQVLRYISPSLAGHYAAELYETLARCLKDGRHRSIVFTEIERLAAFYECLLRVEEKQEQQDWLLRRMEQDSE